MKAFKDNFFVKTVYAYYGIFFTIWCAIFIFWLLSNFANLFLTELTIGLNADYFEIFSSGENKSVQIIPHSFVVAAITLTLFSAILYSIKLLGRFIKNVYEENLFSFENGKILKTIGIITMALAALIHFVKIFTTNVQLPLYLSETLKLLYYLTSGLSVIYNPFLVLGMFVLVIGEVIIHAAKLKEEQDLTV